MSRGVGVEGRKWRWMLLLEGRAAISAVQDFAWDPP